MWKKKQQLHDTLKGKDREKDQNCKDWTDMTNTDKNLNPELDHVNGPQYETRI